MYTEKEMDDLLKFYNMLENFTYEIEQNLNTNLVKPYIEKLNEMFKEVGEKTSLSNRGI